MIKNKVELGDKVKDEVSGYTGIVIGITDWLYGCQRAGIAVQKPGSDGKICDPQWFDTAQLKVIKKSVIKGQTGMVMSSTEQTSEKRSLLSKALGVRRPGGPSRESQAMFRRNG